MPNSVKLYLPRHQAWDTNGNPVQRPAVRALNLQTAVVSQPSLLGSTVFKGIFIVGLITAVIVTVAITVPLVLSKTTAQTTTTTQTTVTATSQTTVTTTSQTTVTTQTTTTTTAPTYCTPVTNDLSVVSYFTFNSSSTTDGGPYPHATTYANQVTTTGKRNQALYFTGNTTQNSYFQISNLTSLGTSNTPYSISLWLSPTALYGDVIFVTVSSNGLGGYCFPFLGSITSTGQLAAQEWDGSTAHSAIGPILPLNSWTHVAETWSSANGLRLYVNGTLYATTAVSSYSASGTPSYMTIASTMSAYSNSGWCTSQGVLVWNYYNGAVDELIIYNRELSTTEVYNLAQC